MSTQKSTENHETLHFIRPKGKFNENNTEKWSKKEIKELFQLPFNDLVYQAHVAHRSNFNPNAVQLSTLLSIKTGGCSEDCGYCPQSARFDTEVDNEPLMDIKEVLNSAKLAKEAGASRFCMGAAWRGPKEKDLN